MGHIRDRKISFVPEGSRPARPHYDYSQSLASSRKRDVPRTYYTYKDGLKGEP